jgi:hypothetical protein
MYYEPERQQMYQLSQIVATMAFDLELHTPIINATLKPSPSPVDALRFGLPTLSPEDLEAKRTFIGCYYITSV